VPPANGISPLIVTLSQPGTSCNAFSLVRQNAGRDGVSGYWGCRQSDRAGPEIERTKTDFCWLKRTKLVMSNAAPARSVTESANLRTNKNFSETLLAHAPAGFHGRLLSDRRQVSHAILQRRINSHQRPVQQRKADGEEKAAHETLVAAFSSTAENSTPFLAQAEPIATRTNAPPPGN